MDINWNIHTLKILIHDYGNDETRQDWIKTVNYKRRFYCIFKVYLAVYWIIEVAVAGTRPLFIRYHEWIFVLAHQAFMIGNSIFLFIMLNCSSYNLYKDIQTEDEPLVNDFEANMPLPFNKNKNPRIVGDVIFIESVSYKKKNLISVGVEVYENTKFKRKTRVKKGHLTHRSIAYKMDASGESIDDISHIRRANKLNRQMCANHKDNKEECKHCNFGEFSDERNRPEIYKSGSDLSNRSYHLSNTHTDLFHSNNSEYDSRRAALKNILHHQIFATKRMIDFTKPSTVESFLKLEESCPVKKTISPPSPTHTEEVEKSEGPIELSMIEVTFPNDS